MDLFNYRDNQLYCEDVRIQELAETYATPLYVYSKNTLLDHYHKLDLALKGLDHLVCFAVKTNGNLAVLHTLAQAGSGFDIVSGGELFRIIQAGGDPSKVVYAGVGKKPREIIEALQAGIYMFNVESQEELLAINQIAQAQGCVARCALRLNPNVDAKTHKHITTATEENKFGVLLPEATKVFLQARELTNIDLSGVHMHLGSQLTSLDPYRTALDKVIPFIEDLRQQGVELKTINLGGGLGIVYGSEQPPTGTNFGETLVPRLKQLGLRVIIEPGRFISGNAGILIMQLLYIKRTPRKSFYIVDTGMNDLIRPALYDARHAALALRNNLQTETADLVGPVCESGDFFLKNEELPKLNNGDFIALRSCGAYGFVMSSNYNARPRAAEVMVDGSEHQLVRRRETYQDLIAGEIK